MIRAQPPVMVFGQLYFRAYHTGDLEKVQAAPDFVAEASACRARRVEHGLAWTIDRQARGDAWPVAVAMLEPWGNGRFALSAYCAELTLRQWAFAAVCARQVLGFMAFERHARVIYAAARSNRPGAVRYLQRLGFVECGHETQGDIELTVFRWRP